MGIIESSQATCDERGLVEKEGRSGEPVSIVLKASFRYTNSRYTLWLVYFDSLHQRLVSSLSVCLKPSDVNMANALRTHDFADSQYLLKFWSKLTKLRELSRTMAYITRKTVNRLACKQLLPAPSYFFHQTPLVPRPRFRSTPLSESLEQATGFKPFHWPIFWMSVSKHREDSWKYDAQRDIFNDRTSQSELQLRRKRRN